MADHEADPFLSPGPSSLGRGDDPFLSTPSRSGRRHGHRNVSASSDSHRLSLAFELAAAMDTDEDGGSSDLLRELGLEEQAEGAMNGIEEEDEGEDEDWEGSRSESDVSMDQGSVDELPQDLDGASTPRAKSSRSSHPDRSPFVHRASPSRSDDFDDFGEDTAVLRANLESTDAFLAQLVQPVTTTSSSRSAADEGEAVVDKLIGEVVRTMAEQTKHREAQTRELKEMEIQFAKTDRRILAELQSLSPPSPTTPFPDGSMADAEDGPTTPSAHRHPIPGDPRTLLSPTSPTSPSLTAAPTTAIESLSQLRSLTASLVSSLSAINEHTQVGRATHGDAARRIKSVRGVVGNVKAEAEGLEVCRLRVGEWERRCDGGQARVKTQVDEASAAIHALLEDAERRARTLLSPVA